MPDTIASQSARRPRRRFRAKRLLPKTLFGRALLLLVTPAVLLQLIVIYFFYETHWDTVSGRLTRSLVGELNMIVAWRAERPGEENWLWMQKRARETMQIDLKFRPGETIPGKPEIRALSILDRMLAQALERHNSRPYYFQTTLANKVRVSLQLQDGVLDATVPLTRVYSTSSYVFILSMLGAAAVLFGLAVWFMRRQLAPIRRLARIADELGKGRDVPDFKPEGTRDVRLAATAFLTMRERIKRQIQQRTEMLAGVSHDLRTPLTRMKLNLAMMGEAEAIGELKSDLSDMEHMIEGYLAFARGEGSEEPVRVDLADLLAEIAANAGRRGLVRGSGIAVTTEGDMEAIVRPMALKRCLTNLVDNAARHAKRVEISAQRHKRWIDITVDDNGPGIAPAEREDVFRPFYRSEGSRNRSTGGVGLGLTIARDVMRGHGGDLTLHDSPLGGLRALARLPV